MGADSHASAEELGPHPNRDDASVVSSSMSAVTADPRSVGRARGRLAPVRRDVHGRADFDAVFDAHYQRLVRTLTVVAGDPEAAADAVQEAFVRAHLRWRRIGAYDDPAGWVRRVAINRLRDEHRRAGRKRRALARLASRSESVTHPAELDEFDRLLAELPTQQRAVTALFYVDGLSIAEIAEALGIADGSVKSHLHDARRRLRPVLEREAGGDHPPRGHPR